MSNLYRGPSIYASYQVSVHMVEGFQRRILKCEKLTDNRRWTPSDGKSSHCLWQGELIKNSIGSESFPGAHIDSRITKVNIVMHRYTGGSLRP